jgi:hypothetical protein
MESFSYILIGSTVAAGIFYMGWVVGCFFVDSERRRRDDLRYDYYGERDFYTNYYSNNSEDKDKNCTVKTKKRRKK